MINLLKRKTGSASREDLAGYARLYGFYPVHPADFVDPAHPVFFSMRMQCQELYHAISLGFMGNRAMSKTYWETRLPVIQSMYLSPLYGKELDELERPELLSYLPPFAEKNVLDLGSGIGRYTGEFAKSAKRVVSVDFAAQMVAENRRLNAALTNIEYIISDAMNLDFPQNSFDLIFTNFLFMYLEDNEVALLIDRISTWLKPNGFLFFRDSCAAVREENSNPSYFAIYRNLIEYPSFFKENWILQKEGNILAHEIVCADPFKCYWLYQNK